MRYVCCEVPINMSYSIESYVNIYEEYVGEENLTLFAVAASVFVLFFFCILWKLLSSQSVKRSGVLFVGLSNSGKTFLLSKILTGKSIETVTSLRENQGAYATENGVLNLVDVPGQGAIRQKYFDQFKNTAKGIVFLIDSESFSRDIKDVAEFLFNILTDREVLKIAPSLLIACNKQDLLASKTMALIREQLEKELNTVRKTRSAALSTTEGEENTVQLGVRGKEFEFSHLGKIKVKFVECNAKGESEGESRLDEMLMWINTLH